MTILQFQELYYIGQTPDFDFDKSVKMVGVMTKLTPEQVDGIPMARFNKICRNIKSHFEFLGADYLKTSPVTMVRSNGRSYRLHYRVDRQPINAGRYIEVIKFGEDVVNNLHKIMASIAEPVKWSWRKMKFIPYQRDHVDIASDMEQVNFRAAYHAAVFFYTHYQVSMILIRPYLIKELIKKGVTRTEAETTMNSLSKFLDGFTMPRWSLNLREYLLNRFGASELSSS